MIEYLDLTVNSRWFCGLVGIRLCVRKHNRRPGRKQEVLLIFWSRTKLRNGDFKVDRTWQIEDRKSDRRSSIGIPFRILTDCQTSQLLSLLLHLTSCKFDCWMDWKAKQICRSCETNKIHFFRNLIFALIHHTLARSVDEHEMKSRMETLSPFAARLSVGFGRLCCVAVDSYRDSIAGKLKSAELKTVKSNSTFVIGERVNEKLHNHFSSSHLTGLYLETIQAFISRLEWF